MLSGCGGAPAEPPPPPQGAIPAGAAIGTAAVTGRVIFRGPAPKRLPVKMSGEAACRRPGAEALSEDLIVNPDGTLRNAYVHVASGLGERVFAPPPRPAELDQAGCVFVPHLLAVQTDQIVVFKNSDPAVHNVRAIARLNPTFNVSMAGQGRTVRRYFPKAERVAIRCDIHAWMGGFIAVESHPFYAVTGDGGTFALKGLPAGEYVVEAWHETLGTERQTVRLGDGEERAVEFAFAK